MAGEGGFLQSLRTKRKQLHDVSDEDFSDFSLSSPALKIRRLDADLPPITEEEVAEVYRSPVANDGPVVVAEEEGSGGNQERAVVLFKPVSSHLLLSPSSFSVSVDSDIISGFKNELPWSRPSHNVKLVEEEDEEARSRDGVDSLAVVPWIPSRIPISQNANAEALTTEAPETMDTEEMGEASMDIEGGGQEQALEFNGIQGSDSLPHWQQQHCMIPQLPQNNSTPITWFQ